MLAPHIIGNQRAGWDAFQCVGYGSCRDADGKHSSVAFIYWQANDEPGCAEVCSDWQADCIAYDYTSDSGHCTLYGSEALQRVRLSHSANGVVLHFPSNGGSQCISTVASSRPPASASANSSASGSSDESNHLYFWWLTERSVCRRKTHLPLAITTTRETEADARARDDAEREETALVSLGVITGGVIIFNIVHYACFPSQRDIELYGMVTSGTLDVASDGK